MAVRAVVLVGPSWRSSACAGLRGGDDPALAQFVPVLAYHVIGDPPAGALYPGLYVSVADFRAQMGWLARRGYHPVTMNALWRHWTRGSPLPAKPIALTFDDGYPEDVDVVRPILRARHWPATLNLHVGNLIPARVAQS